MFGNFAPPQLSDEEIKELEGQASYTVQSFAATVVILYISPFVVDAVSSFF
ncbi:mitochondrial outer membrane translocase complex, subunit Tom5 [Xylariales sp. PMI_506]|nr:mitochondrial outer membrane translocase complex, subunit Tom5 [Xylariales sp. PMI_506]